MVEKNPDQKSAENRQKDKQVKARGLPRGSRRPAEPVVWRKIRDYRPLKSGVGRKGALLSEKKQKYAYWMRPSMVAEIEEMLAAANATSKGDFVCKAIEFYIGYLRQQKNINYLAPMLAGAIKSEVRSLGRDVCEILFKLAVEIGINSNITAAVNDISDESLDTVRLNVAQEVARTNGILTFEDADEWQNGGD